MHRRRMEDVLEDDDGLEWLRAIRRRLSEERQRDPSAWRQRMRELEAAHSGRVLSVEDVAALRERLQAARAATKQSS